MARIVTLGLPAGSADDVDRRAFADGIPLPEEAETVIVVIDAAEDASGLLSRRQVDFSKVLDRGARLVVVVGPDFWTRWSNSVIQWLSQKVGFTMHAAGSAEIRAAVPELRGFFSNQRAHGWIVLSDTAHEDLQILGDAVRETGESIGPASLRYRKGRADICFVPLLGITPNAEDVVLDFLSKLPSRQEYPEYLDEIDLQDESALRGELTEIDVRKAEIAERLAASRRAKQILYLTDLDLEREVVRFLNEELGVNARHVPGSDEDLRLVDAETGEDWGIGEVKGYATKNLPRVELNRVAIHRSEAGFEEDAPALLIANTFHAKMSVAARDEEIPDNVISRARDDHILVVRTLDLIRLKQLALAGRSKNEEFMEAIRDRGGWLEVNAKLEVQLHP